MKKPKLIVFLGVIFGIVNGQLDFDLENENVFGSAPVGPSGGEETSEVGAGIGGLASDVKNKCINKDILVVVEAPLGGDRTENYKKIKTFYANLLTDTEAAPESCIRISFVVADNEVVQIKKLTSAGDISKLDKLANTVAYDILPKQNILQVIKGISDGNTYFDGSKEETIKVILFVLTSAMDLEVPIADKMKSVLEEQNVVGETITPFTAAKYAVVAVGLGLGSKEQLLRITFDKQRIASGTALADLGKSVKLSVYDFIIEIINDPDTQYKKTSYSTGLGIGLDDKGDKFDAINEVIENQDLCSYAVDIGFLVDSSFSIRLDWDQQLLFIQRIANRFAISENGAHAGVVLFSDALNFTRVEINMTDYLSTKAFNKKVETLPYIGYRTRIDYGFEKIKYELFTKAAGIRPRFIPKLVILITDGKQNPPKWKRTIFDPVKASQFLIDDGAAIVGIGIGQDVNKQQLESITRNANRVYYADTISELISDAFVKKVSKRLCNIPGVLATTTTEAPTTTTKPKAAGIGETTCEPTTKPPCAGVGKCSACCGAKDVYINIFQSGSGPNYIMQGMTMSHNNGQLAGLALPGVGPKVNISSGALKSSSSTSKPMAKSEPKTKSEILKLIKDALPNYYGLKEQLKEMLDTYGANKPESSGPLRVGTPGIARKRRSLDEETEEAVYDIHSLIKIAKHAGCKLFFKALQKHQILNNITELISNHGDKVIIFCPLDAAFEEIYKKENSHMDERKILLNHIVVQHKKASLTYNTLLPGSKIRLTPKGISSKQLSWVANNANVLFSLVDSKHGEVIFIDRVLYPQTGSLYKALKSHQNVSMFYELIQKISMKEAFKTDPIDRMCFTTGLCISLTQQLQNHLKVAMEFSQFTVLVPTNREMLKMEKTRLRKLHTDKHALVDWLKDRIYMGRLTEIHGTEKQHEEIVLSVGSSHSVLSKVKGPVSPETDNGVLKLDAFDKLLEVKISIPFNEGMAYIYETV